MGPVMLLLSLTLALILTLPLLALILGADMSSLALAAADPEVLSALCVSLGCASTSTVLALVLGVPAGYVLQHRRLPCHGLWEALCDLPVVVPHPVMGLGLLCVFAHRRLLGAALHAHFGIDVASAAPGIVLAMLIVSAPFVVKAARQGFAAVNPDYARAAAALGLPDAQVFWRVTLPLAWPAIRSGATLAWARAVSEFGSVAVLAYFPRTAPVLIWDRFTSHGLQAALGPALLLLLVCAFVLALMSMLQSRGVHPD